MQIVNQLNRLTGHAKGCNCKGGPFRRFFTWNYLFRYAEKLCTGSFRYHLFSHERSSYHGNFQPFKAKRKKEFKNHFVHRSFHKRAYSSNRSIFHSRYLADATIRYGIIVPFSKASKWNKNWKRLTRINRKIHNTIANKRVDSHKAAGSFSYYSRFIFIHTTGIFHKALLRQHGLHLHYCQSLWLHHSLLQ